MEYPSRLRISATHIAATIAAEGLVRAELAEVTVYQFCWSIVLVPLFHYNASGCRQSADDGRSEAKGVPAVRYSKFRTGGMSASGRASRAEGGVVNGSESA
jgi:hypothetical protein